MKTIAFLGAKDVGYQCLEYLLFNSGLSGAKITCVLTNNKSSLLGKKLSFGKLCEKYNINILESLDDLLTVPEVDILYSVQYHRILKKEHIARARQIAVNLHMAPLPEYRGCNQFSNAIIDGAQEFGTTIHRLEEGIDSGAILFEYRFKVPARWWVRDLYERTCRESIKLFSESLPKIIAGDYTPIPQKTFAGIRKTSFHYRKEIDQMKQIDLSWSKEKIKSYIRATWFPPFDPPFAIVDGRKINITSEWIDNNINLNSLPQHFNQNE